MCICGRLWGTVNDPEVWQKKEIMSLAWEYSFSYFLKF